MIMSKITITKFLGGCSFANKVKTEKFLSFEKLIFQFCLIKDNEL